MAAGEIKTIQVIGFPMDLGADRRGVDLGPAAIRIAGLLETVAALGYRVEDAGDIAVRVKERSTRDNPHLKYLDDIVGSCEALARRVENALFKGQFPMVIGGDHSMAIGTIAGVASYCRKNGKTPGVIWIDAHADMNLETTTPSGNIHGMPMAVSLGLGAFALTHIMGFAPKVAAQNCALIGLRSVDRLEKQTVRNMSLSLYTMADIDRIGIQSVASEVLDRLVGKADHIHVSFDIDSVDPSVAMGVGTPVSGGLTYREAHLLMETFAERGCMASLEVAEVNPILDHKNRSAAFAVELIASSLGLQII
jgi:arginase